MENTLNFYKKLGCFDGRQLEEIRRGLLQGVDVSLYANIKYDYAQMQEIRRGLVNKLDVSLYADPKYNWSQMQESREGLLREQENLKRQEKAREGEIKPSIKLISKDDLGTIMSHIVAKHNLTIGNKSKMIHHLYKDDIRKVSLEMMEVLLEKKLPIIVGEAIVNEVMSLFVGYNSVTTLGALEIKK